VCAVTLSIISPACIISERVSSIARDPALRLNSIRKYLTEQNYR
jgi:hypothetical protein